jgi:hypothetical protein
MVSELSEYWKPYEYLLEHPDSHDGFCGEFELDNKECAEYDSPADFFHPKWGTPEKRETRMKQSSIPTHSDHPTRSPGLS